MQLPSKYCPLSAAVLMVPAEWSKNFQGPTTYWMFSLHCLTDKSFHAQYNKYRQCSQYRWRMVAGWIAFSRYPRIPTAQDTQGYSKIRSDTQHSQFARLPSAGARFAQVDKYRQPGGHPDFLGRDRLTRSVDAQLFMVWDRHNRSGGPLLVVEGNWMQDRRLLKLCTTVWPSNSVGAWSRRQWLVVEPPICGSLNA